MVGVIASHLGLYIAMLVVLVVIGLNVLVTLIQSLRVGANISGLADVLTRPMLFAIIPLLVLSWLMALDPTPYHIVIRIWYYLAALFIILENLMALGNQLQRK